MLESLRKLRESHSITPDQLKVLDALASVDMMTGQLAQQEYLDVFNNDLVLAYAYNIGRLMLDVKLSIDEMKKVANSSQKKFREPVIKALDYVSENMKTDPNGFLKWVNTDFV